MRMVFKVGSANVISCGQGVRVEAGAAAQQENAVAAGDLVNQFMRKASRHFFG